MKLRLLFLISLFLLLLTACTNKPTNIAFPINETEFAPPKKTKLGKSTVVKATPKVISFGKNKPDSIQAPKITKLAKAPAVPFITGVNKLGASKQLPLGTPTITKITNTKTIICKPKTILLGTPEVVICKPAQTADNAINNLKFYSQDQGLVATVAQCMVKDKHGNIWVGTDGGLCFFDGHKWYNYTVKQGLSNNYVNSLLEMSDGKLLIGTYGGGLNVLDLQSQSLINYSTAQGLSNNYVLSLLEMSDGKLLIGTNGGGLNVLDLQSQNLINYSTAQGLPNDQVLSIQQDSLGGFWLGTGKGLCKLIKKGDNFIVQKCLDKREGMRYMDFNTNAMEITKRGTLWAGTGDALLALNPYYKIDTTPPFVSITAIDIMEKKETWFLAKNIIAASSAKDTLWASALDTFYIKSANISDTSYFIKNNISYSNVDESMFHLPQNLVLPVSQNHLSFHFSGTHLGADEDRVRYRYILDGLDKAWSPITYKMEADYRNIPPGNYIFKIAARSVNGYWSKPVEFAFEVLPPWYQHPMAYAGYVIGFISIVFGFNGVRTKQLKLRQQQLEKTVEERTEELVQKNIVVEQQKHLVEEKHKEITDSINYAERIQRSFLATKELLDENLGEYFVFFKPKDVVSGDFYWAAEIQDSRFKIQDSKFEIQDTVITTNKKNLTSTISNFKFILVTADSTGHGVPGAIMSLLNITSLEKAVETLTQPSAILNATRKTIIERLKKDGSPEGGKDGMDASLCIYDFKNMKLTVAAANNPVWIIRNSGTDAVEVLEVKPDKMPIGKHDRDTVSFTQKEINLQSGDVVYTLTDGFPDQFGGPNGKKFMSKNLRELLAANAQLPLTEQKQLLEKTFANWKGNLEQVDDVCLIGVRV